jgi:hypothetical protein
MANKITPASSQYQIESDHVLRMASDESDRRLMKEAVDEFERLQRLNNELVIPHCATEAWLELKAADVAVLDDASFRGIFLARTAGDDVMRGQGWEIDTRIVAKLTRRVSPIVNGIKRKAVQFLEGEIKEQAARAEDIARARKFGLPDEVAYNTLYRCLRELRESIMASLDTDVVLTNGGDRRGILGRYFSKPL